MSHPDDIDAELQRLTAASRELLESLRGSTPESPAAAPSPAPAGESDELVRLRQENEELRSLCLELEQQLQKTEAAPGGGDEGWAERQREYEALLEEKSEVIRGLHQKIRELQERPSAAPTAAGATPAAGDLQRMQEELEEQRRQLQEDEEAMVTQLREMEMSLSRDRAELARQRQEVQRLQNELAREIEMAGKDPALRDRLNSLRRASDRGTAPAAPPAAQQPQQPAAGSESKGIFRRLFG